MNRSNDINASGGRLRSFLSSVDFYRRVPRDLSEATSLGVTMSLISVSLMVILFCSETLEFMTPSIVTEISLDDNTIPSIRINFNLTFPSLQCEYASVDILDSLGTNRQNVTKNVEKWHLDEEGTRRIFGGRNREVRQVKHEEHEETLEELHADGVDAHPLDRDSMSKFLKDHEMAFINFFAPWCVWCQRLHPTWEKYAEEVKQKDVPVGVGSVDCAANADVCRDNNIMAFPSLKWFVKGEADVPDYKADRSVKSLMDYTTTKLQQHENYKNWREKNNVQTESRQNTGRPDYPGCQLSGFILVNRVKGNFHILAHSVNHNLNAAATNLTHTVNHLSFGERIQYQHPKVKRILKKIPKDYQEFNPMDNTPYPMAQYHQAFHHYIKVVSTHLDIAGKSDKLLTYQFIEQSQIVKYKQGDVPEARFSYDISPMSVIVKKKSLKWYDYVTSLFAIIGGTFTTLGLVDASLYKVFKPKKL